jgi:hypothetical protein
VIIVTETDNDDIVRAAMRARTEGRHEEALRHVLVAFAQVMDEGPGSHVRDFGTMLEWHFLAEEYPPARAALLEARDAQAQRLLAGDTGYGRPPREGAQRRSRFALIAHMNETLQDSRATYELFVQLDALMPEHARRMAFLALPAVVEAGDFTLGERYLPDPMDFLPEVNESSHIWPLFPPTKTAPRLAAELSNFAKDVRLRAAILRGLAREAEAEALLEAAMAGLANDELRDWLRRDLASPGAIMHASTEHRMAQEAAGR